MTTGEIMVWHALGFYAISGWLLFSWINKKLNKRRDQIFDRILDIPMVSFEEFHDGIEEIAQGQRRLVKRKVNNARRNQKTDNKP